MSELAAISGTFADFKIVRGRKCAQLVIEVPLEQADAALNALGGLPNPAMERWVAVARLNQGKQAAEPKQAKAADRKTWNDLPPAQRAAIKCGEESFRDFLGHKICDQRGWEFPKEADEAAQVVRLICGVESRSDLNTDSAARAAWERIENDYWLWQRGYQQ